MLIENFVQIIDSIRQFYLSG